MNTFIGPYFHFCSELALETWVKASLSHSLEIYDLVCAPTIDSSYVGGMYAWNSPLQLVFHLDHTHSLVSFWWSGLHDKPPDWKLPTVPKWCPYRGKEWFLCLFVPKWFSQWWLRPLQLPCAWHVVTMPTHLAFPFLPFLVVTVNSLALSSTSYE